MKTLCQLLINSDYQTKKCASLIICECSLNTKSQDNFEEVCKAFEFLGNSKSSFHKKTFLNIIQIGFKYFSQIFYMKFFYPLFILLEKEEAPCIRAIFVKIIPLFIKKIVDKNMISKLLQTFEKLLEDKDRIVKQEAENVKAEMLSLSLSEDFKGKIDDKGEEILLNHEELIKELKEKV